MEERKQRIVILGGGISSLATAYSLTSRPDWQSRYEITVYQMGFRLGGKGASGRNRELANRIEEHGIHVFFGFYDNAFRIMKECYEELGRPAGAPLARVTDAFKPYPRITFTEKLNGQWSVWPWDFPANEHRLGEGGPIPTPWGYVKLLLRHMTEWYEQVVADTPTDLKARLGAWTPDLGGPLGRPLDAVLDKVVLPPLIDRLWQRNSRSAFNAVREVIDALMRSADAVLGDPDPSRRADRLALAQLVRRARVVRESARWLGQRLREVPSLRRALVLLDFAIATIIGLVEDEVVYLPEDWRKMDSIDLKKWLAKHGAAPETADCALIQGMYAGIFSVEHEVGAGTMLHYTLRMLFAYRGAVLYKMQAGMGDVVFAPLYQVLRRRGVRFEFFHRVDRLELDPGHRRIARVVVGRQMAVARGAYEPLFDVNGLPCWPSEPLYEQLVDGERLRASGESLEDAWTAWPDALPPRVLEDGRDFDLVVLGISLGALPGLCGELADDPTNPRFRQMLAALRTTQTQAMQLWHKPSLEGLGWRHGNSITIPYEEPYDTWTDMAHLVPRESWRQGEVGGIAYLCSPMADEEPIPPPGDHGYARRQHARAAANARGWLERHAGWLWPRAAGRPSGTGFDWSLLVDREERTGAARFEAQHVAVPTNLSDRYNLSLPGTVSSRLPAGGSGYGNLVLAGDWTLNPINAGCVEAATMSGLLAARTISGEPKHIPGDWVSGLPDLSGPAASKLPAYVPLDGNDTPVPPFIARRTRMFVFPVEARLGSLAALCHRLLHLGGPVRYRPAAPLAFFYCQDNALMESSAPRAAIRELDFGFLIPLLATPPDGAARIVTLAPYLWVDTELACRAGREIYGYPKAEGTLGMPEGDGGVFSVDGMVAEPGAGSGAGSWVTRRLVEARPTAKAPRAVGDARGPAELLVALFADVLGAGLAELAGSAGDLAAGVVPMVFLKQFRDVADPTRACYQAIVEAEVRQTGGLAGGMLGHDYELVVRDHPGFPIASRLGLVGRRQGDEVVVPVRLPLSLELDFMLDTGRVVWP